MPNEFFKPEAVPSVLEGEYEYTVKFAENPYTAHDDPFRKGIQLYKEVLMVANEGSGDW